ncbi:MAG: CoA-binding protein [Oscillatoriales cyanobacterium RM2_1_1]|nr:CoA-binding protein [Oscillatoriales cyanobacterium SM2_3_0]NJO46322.1 CoA-binding protein [Oscillatoriales cyanobacterium RM2_1_1]
MNPKDLNRNDQAMGQILSQAQVVAVVGHSDQPDRTSYQIAQFLRQVGYRVYPVNPMIQMIQGQPCYRDLKSVPEPIDIVNVFRRSEFLAEITAAAITVQARTLWGQLGVVDWAAAEMAQKAGLSVAMDRCIKIEYERLKIHC